MAVTEARPPNGSSNEIYGVSFPLFTDGDRTLPRGKGVV